MLKLQVSPPLSSVAKPGCDSGLPNGGGWITAWSFL